MDNKPTNESLQQNNLSSSQPGETSPKPSPRLPVLLAALAGVILIGS